MGFDCVARLGMARVLVGIVGDFYLRWLKSRGQFLFYLLLNRHRANFRHSRPLIQSRDTPVHTKRRARTPEHNM
jgi:hypothetical protein